MSVLPSTTPAVPLHETAPRTRPVALPALTSIRFFAAVWVVLYHYNDEIGPSLPGWLNWLVNGGHLGVSLFFVLSGFILTYNYADRPPQGGAGLFQFGRQRFARIYPLYILSILIMVPRLFIEAGQDTIRYFQEHPWTTALSHLTLTQVWFGNSFNILNAPTWSVACEAGFYLAFPLLLPWVLRLPRGRLLPLAAAALLLFSIPPLLYANAIFAILAGRFGWAYDAGIDTSINSYITVLPVFRIGEFIIGMLVARLFALTPVWDGPKRAGLALAVVAGFTLMVIGIVRQSIPGQHLITQVTLGTPFFAAFVLALAVANRGGSRFLALPSLVLLGNASYALYLLHIPTKHGFRLIAERVAPGVSQNVLFSLTTIAITIGLSLLAYRYVEVPAQRWLTRKRAQPVAASAATSV